jgi:hypothetical protein
MTTHKKINTLAEIHNMDNQSSSTQLQQQVSNAVVIIKDVINNDPGETPDQIVNKLSDIPEEKLESLDGFSDKQIEGCL